MNKALAWAFVPLLIVSCAGTAHGLQIENVTANLSLPTETGAVYLRIANRTSEAEQLVGAELAGCSAIELHEMRLEGDVMMMRPVEGGAIDVPAGETVVLKPGGLHLMCIGKEDEFAVGDLVPVTLAFAQAGQVEVMAEVTPPGE